MKKNFQALQYICRTIVSSSSTSVSGPAKCQPNQSCPISRANCPADEFFKLSAACDPSDNDKDTLSAKDLAKNLYRMDSMGAKVFYLANWRGMKKAQKCIDTFDVNGDGVLNKDEWKGLDQMLAIQFNRIYLDMTSHIYVYCVPIRQGFFCAFGT